MVGNSIRDAVEIKGKYFKMISQHLFVQIFGERLPSLAGYRPPLLARMPIVTFSEAPDWASPMTKKRYK